MGTDYTKSVNHVFAQAAKLVRSYAEKELSKMELHVGQNLLLLQLYEKDGRRPGEIADQLNVDPSVISKMLRRMESQELVERRSDPDDARVTRVFLTDNGKSLQDSVEDFQQRFEERMLQGFSTEEKLLFRRMLSNVYDNFAQSDPPNLKP